MKNKNENIIQKPAKNWRRNPNPIGAGQPVMLTRRERGSGRISPGLSEHRGPHNDPYGKRLEVAVPDTSGSGPQQVL
jgi:hypothetical protein